MTATEDLVMTTDAIFLKNDKIQPHKSRTSCKDSPMSKSCLYAKLRFHFLSVFFLGGDVMYYDDYYTLYVQRTQLTLR